MSNLANRGGNPALEYRQLGTNKASIGIGGFLFAALLAGAWLGISWWLAIPWAGDLGLLVGIAPAWLIIGGVALAPGFMNAFQMTSLLLRPAGQYVEPDHYPPVTVLVAAFNEAENIAETLTSILGQHYPGEVEIIVIDDGSSDGTADIVTGHFGTVRLIVQPVNSGKASALNIGLSKASHGLIVTVDADCWLHVDAIRLLVSEYLNGQPMTGAVAGAVFVRNPEASWVSRIQYWDYFHGIAATKRTQAAYGGTLVAQGAFSIYRAEILRSIGGWPDCVGEDIVVTWAILQKGFFVGYAENALCLTRVPETLGALIRQRARWARGMFEALRCHPRILLKRRLSTALIYCNLLFPWIDFTFTFFFLPGIILALFGYFWLVGPITLALIPPALLIGAVMYRMSARIFKVQGLRIERDISALVGYTFAYGFINHPASLRGYSAEVFGARKSWGTK